VSNMGVGFKLYQLQNATHFLPHWKKKNSLIEAKWDGTQLSNTARMRLEDDLDQTGEKLEELQHKMN